LAKSRWFDWTLVRLREPNHPPVHVALVHDIGICKQHGEDGLAYQERMRSKWDR
jgi:hypothetical protein